MHKKLHNGLTFIAPINREVVNIVPKPSDFVVNIIDFEKTFMQFCIDYLYKNKDNVEPYYTEALTKLEKMV